MNIVDHKLEGVPFRNSPNHGGIMVPEYLVAHYTATQKSAAPIFMLPRGALSVSIHLQIDRDGSVEQFVPFNVKAWHAGASQWAGKSGCNGFTIGIELVNPGPLHLATSPHGTGMLDIYGREWDGTTIDARHKNGGPYSHWAAYSPEQLEKFVEVGQALVEHYGLKDVIGHEDIAPFRKIDPGPAFPMESVRGRLFGRADDGPPTWVTTDVLNVREGAGVQFKSVERGPLPKGTHVHVIEQGGLWWHVVADLPFKPMVPLAGDPATMQVEGYVNSRFLVRA